MEGVKKWEPQWGSLRFPVATSQKNRSAKSSSGPHIWTKGWDSNLNLGSKVVERLRMSLPYFMGVLSSTDSVWSCTLCISSLAGEWVSGESQHSHALFVELVCQHCPLCWFRNRPGGPRRDANFKKRCKLTVQEEFSLGYWSKQKQEEHYGWTDKPAVLQAGWLDGTGWKKKALSCWRRQALGSMRQTAEKLRTES